MQSSKLFAGLQWNMPVESYFISVFSKSKSFDWSSAMPAGSETPPFWFCVPVPELRLVGLEANGVNYGNVLAVFSPHQVWLSFGIQFEFEFAILEFRGI